MPSLLDFAPDDELKKYFWESDSYYCLSSDINDEVALDKIRTKIKIERRPNPKKKTMEFSLMRFDYWEGGSDFLPIPSENIWKKEEEAKNDFLWQKGFIELLSSDRKVFDGRYFWDFEFSEGKPKLTNRFLGKFEGEWV